jgi:hypothetical protein
MNDERFEFTDSDRKVLLQGLRYVRSSIMLETRDPTEDDEARRGEQLRDIADIVHRLNATPAVATADV